MGGCLASKHVVSVNPAADHGAAAREERGVRFFSSSRLSQAALAVQETKRAGESARTDEEIVKGSSKEASSMSFRLSNLHRYLEGEHVAAGWPAWLSAVAGEAIQGWVPLKADSYETLEKIGQGTYSSVFRAREKSTGKIFALKKVRFDNYDMESVKFMAREIQILRKLDHPNVVKLEGLITSRLSCSIYLVFEYMEHDLAGLSSSPDIKFSEPQVKCYMKQLISGLEHCHSMGIMHRDIKCSNLLINNEGILKIADFGLANFMRRTRKQPLTSRVVTLWYRPPELLLGSTDYGPSIDMWSVGCVLAELLTGKPILQGRTEVEQLHKIFKLCGSPSDEYWKKSKLPHATIFKPHHPYGSSLREKFQSLPECALGLVENLLSVEPNKRLSATSSLLSEFFSTAPLACDPSSLPSYPPNKEIDAKSREQSRRRRLSGRSRNSEEATTGKPAPRPQELVANLREPMKVGYAKQHEHKGSVSNFPMDERNCVFDSRPVKRSPESIPFSGPLPAPPNSFSWARRNDDESNARMRRSSESKSRIDSRRDLQRRMPPMSSVRRQSTEIRGPKLDRQDSFGSLDQPQIRQRQNRSADPERVEFSGPLLYKPHRMNDFLENNERKIRMRSWFRKGQK